MKKSRLLKLSTLIELGACSDQVELFRKTFGESVRVTEKLCLSVSDKFAWTWAASHLLSALTEYARVRALAWAEYKRVISLACSEYERAIAPAVATRAEYERITAPARTEYERAKALAFARGYLS
jgi:hypothetical protein